MQAANSPVFHLATCQSGNNSPVPVLVTADRCYPLEHRWPSVLAIFEAWSEAWPALVQLAASPDRPALPPGSLRWLSPVVPRQILCAGANYRKHVVDLMIDHESGSFADRPPDERRRLAERIMDHRAQQGQPYAFLKPFTALAGPQEGLPVPLDSTETDWELELTVAMGRSAHRVSREHALDCVAGYTIANDISARDHIRRPDFPQLGMDWLACKGKPGFLPLGPMILPAAFVSNPQDLQLTLRLNGQIMQDESTADMIFPVAQLIEFISTHVQLLPGDIICTGSPSGNGTHHKRFLRPGDVMEGSITGIGVLRTDCVAEERADSAVTHRPFRAVELPV